LEQVVEEIQNRFESAGRAILRYLDANKNELTPKETAKLAKFMFGCMNQRFTIASRVQSRGSKELESALKFIGKATEELLRIDERLRGEKGE
jgi:phage host-nuclease inhibitor protein Gam